MSTSTSYSNAYHDEDENDPSTQLRTELITSITHSLSPNPTTSKRRPLLTHLNADTTWLLSIPIPLPPQNKPPQKTPPPQFAPTPTTTTYKSPYPSPPPTKIYRSPYPSTKPYVSPYAQPAPKDESWKRQKRERKRVYYHILIDPWLRGPQSDVAAFFSTQWHAEPSACQTIAEVEDCILGLENVASGCESSEQMQRMAEREKEGRSVIDAVVVSHEFTDHMHKDTLLEIGREVPVYATTKAAAIIRGWKHFEHVRDIEGFTGNWRDQTVKEGEEENGVLGWISVTRLAYPGRDLLYYHSAIMITFSSPPSQEAEAIIYTPHGISPEVAQPVSMAQPPINTLALLHGLQDISISSGWVGMGAQLNKGAHNGLKVQRSIGAKYWVGTHDEVKKGVGVVSWVLKRRKISLEEALEVARHEEEEQEQEEGEEQRAICGLGDVRFVELGNGESLVLE